MKLKDGSLYRGVIMELAVGDHVTMRLDSGESRRFAAADVAYAGSADAAPKPPVRRFHRPHHLRPPTGSEPRPLVTVNAAEAKVHFESPSPDVDFHLRVEDATAVGWSGRGAYGFVLHGYTHICNAPCDATLPAGRHRLALSQSGGVPIEADEAVDLSGPSKVTGTYQSSQGTRVAGWVVMLGSTVAGTAMMIAAIQSGRTAATRPSPAAARRRRSSMVGSSGRGRRARARDPRGAGAHPAARPRHDHRGAARRGGGVPAPFRQVRGGLAGRVAAASAPGIGLRVTF